MRTEKISLWRERIANKEANGLNLTNWCAQKQLTKHAYYYWKRKLKVWMLINQTHKKGLSQNSLDKLLSKKLICYSATAP
ncbi:MAG: hypothetical protein WCD89_08675 [Anaerocolumna sp.]